MRSDVVPCRPKAAKQNPKYSILGSQPRLRVFSPEYRQLLTEGKDLKTEIVARTEEWAEASEQTDKKCNQWDRIYSTGSVPAPALIA